MKKKEKVLIFRTAKMQVVDCLMKQIDKESEIIFLAQTDVVDELKNKYPFAEVVSIQDTYFSYESFCKNVTLDKRFDRIYVLASGSLFGGFEEVFKIITEMKYRKLILFNGKGEQQVEERNCFKIILDNIYFVFAQAYMKIVAVWYEAFWKKYKF